MSSLQDIRQPVDSELRKFEANFKQSFRTNVFLLDTVTSYMMKTKGKQMRPLLVFLSAGICGTITESTHRAASMIELLHSATLIHDDVVDDSNERRGFFSINALWKNKIAVLVGDFLLSKGLLIALDHKEHDLLSIVADATRQMSEGELLQIEKARRLDIEEKTYFEIIEKKTASLFAACNACGAVSVGASEDEIALLKSIGIHLGIAFQIKDDLLDFDLKGKTGKPSGIDLKEKKLTLPVIYLLNKSSFIEKQNIIRSIKRKSNRPEVIHRLIQQVIESGGIEYAQNKMAEFQNLAMASLSKLPQNPCNVALQELIHFTVDRRH